jgi:hypothetical protein
MDTEHVYRHKVTGQLVAITADVDDYMFHNHDRRPAVAYQAIGSDEDPIMMATAKFLEAFEVTTKRV